MTVINNVPAAPAQDSGGNGIGFLVGIIVLALIAYLFFVYGIPAVQRGASMSAPTVQVPSELNVNVDTPASDSE